jgi:hypothetical protein
MTDANEKSPEAVEKLLGVGAREKPVVPEMRFPRDENPTGGWTLKTDFLGAVREEIKNRENDGIPTEETIEDVLLAAEQVVAGMMGGEKCPF